MKVETRTYGGRDGWRLAGEVRTWAEARAMVVGATVARLYDARTFLVGQTLFRFSDPLPRVLTDSARGPDLDMDLEVLR